MDCHKIVTWLARIRNSSQNIFQQTHRFVVLLEKNQIVSKWLNFESYRAYIPELKIYAKA